MIPAALIALGAMAGSIGVAVTMGIYSIKSHQ